VLEDGRITAIGSHEELLTSSPTYQRLYHLQFRDMPEGASNSPAGEDISEFSPVQIPDPQLQHE